MMGDIERNNNYNNNNNEEILRADHLQEDGFVGTPIQRFYAGQKIFITGGTGFLGKILVEKLLRSCSDISKIYLLVRPKKGKDSNSRLGELFQDRVYDRLRKVMPNFRDKIVPVIGDCSVKGLSLSEEDTQLLAREVSIVFHAAATVRFDEKLKLALDINVRSTNDVIALCKRISNLKAFVHVSTAYANCHLKQIDERFYEYPISHKDLLDFADTLPQDELEKKTSKYLQTWPNTYAFTKAIAESLIRDKCHDLPVAIFRPAIVVATHKEPVPGWIDNLYGPTGLLAAGTSGLLRFIHCDPDVVADLVPADLTVNALIASAWDLSRQSGSKEIPIYNYVSSVEAPMNWRQFQRWSLQAAEVYPLQNAVWHFSNTLVKNKTLYAIAGIVGHFLPALILDFVSICVGRKPRLWKTYSKVHKYSDVIAHFSLNEWTFTNDNLRAMWFRTNEKDKQMFRFSMKDFDWEKFFYDYVLGVRTHMFKEDSETLPASRVRLVRLYWTHKIVMGFLLLGVLSMFWRLLTMIFDS